MKQVSGSAGVKECSENLAHTALKVLLQGGAPFRWVMLGTVNTGIGHIFSQSGQ